MQTGRFRIYFSQVQFIYIFLHLTNVTIVYCKINVTSPLHRDLRRSDFNSFDSEDMLYFPLFFILRSTNTVSSHREIVFPSTGMQSRINTYMNSGNERGVLYRSRTVSSDLRGTEDLFGQRTRLGNVRGDGRGWQTP